MTVRLFAFFISIGTIIAWVAWVLVLYGINPEQTSFAGLFVFYASLALALFGTIFLLSRLLVDRLSFSKNKKQHPHKRFTAALRYGSLLTIWIIGWLWMQSNGYASALTISLFIILLLIVDLFLISRHKKNTSYERFDTTPT